MTVDDRERDAKVKYFETREEAEQFFLQFCHHGYIEKIDCRLCEDEGKILVKVRDVNVHGFEYIDCPSCGKEVRQWI